MTFANVFSRIALPFDFISRFSAILIYVNDHRCYRLHVYCGH